MNSRRERSTLIRRQELCELLHSMMLRGRRDFEPSGVTLNYIDFLQARVRHYTEVIAYLDSRIARGSTTRKGVSAMAFGPGDTTKNERNPQAEPASEPYPADEVSEPDFEADSDSGVWSQDD